jgi:hypothetical protein
VVKNQQPATSNQQPTINNTMPMRFARFFSNLPRWPNNFHPGNINRPRLFSEFFRDGALILNSFKK